MYHAAVQNCGGGLAAHSTVASLRSGTHSAGRFTPRFASFPRCARERCPQHLTGVPPYPRPMVDWTEKYRPSSLSEVRGNDKARDALAEWAETWDEHGDAVILHGSPGVGKT